MRKIIVAICMLVFLSNAFAQKDLLGKISGNRGITKQFTTLETSEQVTFDSKQARQIFGLDQNSDLILLNSEKDKLGFIHFRYQQVYNGIPVENSMYIAHTQKSKLTGMSGSVVTQFDRQKVSRSSAVLSARSAIDAALKYVGAKKYAWEDESFNQRIKMRKGKNATYYPVAQKVWYSGEDELDPSNLRLAYKIDVYSIAPLDRKFVYVDAVTGKILGTKQEIMHTDATGTAATGYSGTQTIHSDLYGSSYRLRDLTKGNGIVTLHASTGHADYTSASANWTLSGADKWALDAHFGAASTWTFYKNNFNRNSVDNAGFALVSWVNDASNPDNAYWDGSEMDYGNLSSNGNGVVGIDVTGHELTHGVTQYTCNLTYSKEPGAMNESMSDIMGKSVQFYTKPTDNSWILSNDMGWEIRSFSNPNADGQPDTYKGTYWASTSTSTSANDYGGVHTNSGVGNFMFYLLVTGGSGTNDIGNAYNVSGIGLAKADQIIYRTQSVYLTSTSQYADWRTACINAATDLYGVGSNEVIQVQNAWYAVGIGAAGGIACAAPTGLNISGITDNTATFTWSAVSGSIGYNVQYRPVGTTTWITGTSAVTSFSASGLIPGTNYECQVKNNCSASSSSSFTSSVTFTTTGIAPCNVPAGMSTASITASSAVLSWGLASGAASYNVQYRVVGAATWTTGTSASTSFTASGLTPATNYEWQVQTVCSSSGTTAFTSSVTFSTTAISYCTSVGKTLDGITNVTYNTINNTTSGTASGYTDYTATQSTTVTQGTAYSLSVKINTGGNYTNYTKAWIDWNHDGTFSTATEEYNLGTATNVTSGTTSLSPLSITVPAGSYVGTTRMRVSTQYNAAPTPCNASFDGEVEDYSVVIAATSSCATPTGLAVSGITDTTANLTWTAVAGATGYNIRYRITGAASWTTGIAALNTFSAVNLTPGSNYECQVQTICSVSSTSAFSASATFATTAPFVCAVPAGLAASSITTTGATLGWTAVSGAVTYNLQWKLSASATWTTVSGLTANSYNFTGLTAGSTYQFQVATVCSASGSVYSSAVSFTTGSGTVTYCASRGTSTSEYIKTVVLNTINHTVANDGGYGDFTALSTSLTAGTSYSIKLTPGFASTKYKQYWTVYIDYNHDGVLNGTGETVAKSTTSSSSTVSYTFTVPLTAKNGATRIRIQMSYGSASTNPCATITYGDVHDYTVNISGGTGLAASENGFAASSVQISNKPTGLNIWPNPSSKANSTTVDYQLTKEGQVKLSVVDLSGRNIQNISLGKQKEGAHTYILNRVKDLYKGNYIIILYQNNEIVDRKKLIVTD